MDQMIIWPPDELQNLLEISAVVFKYCCWRDLLVLPEGAIKKRPEIASGPFKEASYCILAVTLLMMSFSIFDSALPTNG